MHSTMLHNVKNVTTDGVAHHNANAITLNIQTGDCSFVDITLFDLPKNIADALEDLLGNGGIKPVLDEDASGCVTRSDPFSDGIPF